MRTIDADKIKYENRNGEMVATKDSIDAIEAEPIEIPAQPTLTKLEIMGFKTRCAICGFERFFEGTTIGEYAYCEKCGSKIMTQEEAENVDQEPDGSDDN